MKNLLFDRVGRHQGRRESIDRASIVRYPSLTRHWSAGCLRMGVLCESISLGGRKT